MPHGAYAVVSHEEGLWGVVSTWMVVIGSSVVIGRIRHKVERQSEIARSDDPVRGINACRGGPGNIHLHNTASTHVCSRQDL